MTPRADGRWLSDALSRGRPNSAREIVYKLLTLIG